MKKVISYLFLHMCFAILIVSTAYADYGLMLGSFRDRDNAEKYMADFKKNHREIAIKCFCRRKPDTGKRGLV